MIKIQPIVRFSHHYDKLDCVVFPTVRSKDLMKRKGISIGTIVLIDEPSGKYHAELIAYEDKRISEMSLKFLQYDAYPENVNSQQDFVNVINSFLKYQSNRLTTTKRILWFKKTTTNMIE